VTAIPHAAGRGVANSITLAHGRRDAALVTPVVREHAARLVALCIDETGMATSAARKLEVAERIYRELVGGLGLDAGALIIDVLTFPLATDRLERRDLARETIAAVGLVRKALPDVQTMLGISDVSFGLQPSARRILNAVFLHHCAAAGLNLAIVDPATLLPYHRLADEERALAEDLIFNRREDALERFTAVLPEGTSTA
jgi:5-methyltetrahydrofolate--homocysteine methyltransferase